MIGYIIRRILLAFPTVIGVLLITFCLFFLIVSPDNLARKNIGARNPTPQQIKAWKVQHGYDRPPSQQFVNMMSSMLTFNFGKSDVTGEPVIDKMKSGVGPSLAWSVPAFIASLFVTIPFALLLAYHRGTYLDFMGTFLCVALMSIATPVYVIVGQYVIGKVLRLTPIMGYEHGLAATRFVILPVVIGVISGIGGTTRFYRTVMLEEMRQDYVRTARAKGVGENPILFKHVLKNAMIPILTSSVMSIPFLILGALIMEQFFGIPGLGSIAIDAINSMDFAVIRATVFIGSLLYIIGALLTDISYTLVDPRVRLE